MPKNDCKHEWDFLLGEDETGALVVCKHCNEMEFVPIEELADFKTAFPNAKIREEKDKPTIQTPGSTKEECQKMYEQISHAEQRLKELRASCKHPSTFEGNYSYRPGAINRATICSDCGDVVKIDF